MEDLKNVKVNLLDKICNKIVKEVLKMQKKLAYLMLPIC